jgi:CheY-like chemotaxis protein
LEEFMSSIRALVIDDNAQGLKVIAGMLAKQGVQSVEVNDPTRLAALLPTLDPINVVFLDLEMPGLDGYAVKDLLRTHLGAVPIIAYTVHISEMHVVRQLGFDGFIGKPLDHARFPDQLARILRREPVWERV